MECKAARAMAFSGGTVRQRHGDGRSGGCTEATGHGHGAAAWCGSGRDGATAAARGVRESSGGAQPWGSGAAWQRQHNATVVARDVREARLGTGGGGGTMECKAARAMPFGGGTVRQWHGDGRSGGCTEATGRGHGVAAWRGSGWHGPTAAARGMRESSGGAQPWGGGVAWQRQHSATVVARDVREARLGTGGGGGTVVPAEEGSE
ncbi:hypothetical protein GUJ93_ZPchr0012g21246 [Zizania palustris]|uniref:Uncharacterized protein n=1 Tax=Zizania palustris TaxID=103762 RepID=A0A8J5WU65_ZIZPA|nr:hypothetical protein GUJ93_ZPchr0012g21246 [Zizania palustris]